MSEYDVLLGDEAREFFAVADEKTTRICKEKLPIDGRRDRYRMHISRTYTAIYRVVEDETQVRVLEIVPIDEAHKRYGF